MKNILFLMIDCLRADVVSAEARGGYPNIKALFDSGMSFTEAVSVTSTTTPNVTSMLTGNYPFAHGILTLGSARLGNEIPTMPSLLKGMGYNTYAEVTGPLYADMGLDKGFDSYNHRPAERTVFTSFGDEVKGRFTGGGFKAPWFVFLHIWVLHTPRQVLPEFDNVSHGKSPYIRALASLDNWLGGLFKALDMDKTLVIFTGDHGEQIEKSRADFFIKKLMRRKYDMLGKLGIDKRKRYEAFRGMHMGHGFHIYDELVRVPLVFTDRDRFPAAEVKAQASHVDMLPTLLEALGFDMGKLPPMSGRSLLLWPKDGPDLEHAAFHQASGIVLPNREEWIEGIRYKGYKYAHLMYHPDRMCELYHLGSDPGERKNIARQHPEMVRAMREKLAELKKGHAHADAGALSADEAAEIRERLKSIGYID